MWRGLRRTQATGRLVTASSQELGRRKFHLNEQAALDLVRSGMTGNVVVSEGFASRDAEEKKPIRIKIHASRATHTPAVEIIRKHRRHRRIPFGLDLTASPPPLDQQNACPPELRQTVLDMCSLWLGNDLSRLEVSAVIEGDRIALDNVRVMVDDFSPRGRDKYGGQADEKYMHALEIQAQRDKLFYHKVRGGNIGCYGYGAGVAMSTMDALKAFGGSPANFLDGGGGATPENVEAAMSLILSDPDVQVIFINSFGGLTKTNLIAQGVVDHLRKRKSTLSVGDEPYPPMYIRLRGTEEEEAWATLEGAKDLENIYLFRDMKDAAAAAVEAANGLSIKAASSELESSSARGESAGVSPSPSKGERSAPRLHANPPPLGDYESTMANIMPSEGAKVLIMGTGKASQFHNKVAQDYGTNIVAAVAPKKGGEEFLDMPVYRSVAEAVKEHSPHAVAVFVPAEKAADAILECVDAEIPLVVSFAEGMPLHDQLRVQARIRAQSKSRLIGANCPGMIIPSLRFKLGIQPLAVHSPGCIGLASRSGTISYELAAATTELGYGQSIVIGLGGDPFPGTRTWEALRVMLDDPRTEVICLVGEIGGQMEEEAAAVYREYKKRLPADQTPKPVVGFLAGSFTKRETTYGHAGAVWFAHTEQAGAKRAHWEQAGFIMADTLGDVGAKIKEAMQAVESRKHRAADVDA